MTPYFKTLAATSLALLFSAAVPAAAQKTPAPAPKAPAAASATAASATPPSAQLQSAGSEIVFVTRQMNVPVEGRFNKFTAQIALDPKKPESGRVSFSIDTSSARFGAPETDAEVPKAPWLNAAQFPQATFQSSAIKATAPGRFDVMGKLSIKGQTRDITVPVQLAQSGAASTATGSFVIKRLEFKVGEGEWADTSIVANDIQVRFKLALTGLGAF